MGHNTPNSMCPSIGGWSSLFLFCTIYYLLFIETLQVAADQQPCEPRVLDTIQQDPVSIFLSKYCCFIIIAQLMQHSIKVKRKRDKNALQ